MKERDRGHKGVNKKETRSRARGGKAKVRSIKPSTARITKQRAD